jgi:acetate kinase
MGASAGNLDSGVLLYLMDDQGMHARAQLAIELEGAAHAACGRRVSTAASRAAAWTAPTNGELMIARGTRRLLRA